MADVKISQLPQAILPLTGSEIFPVVQNGVTVQAPVKSVGTAANIIALRSITPTSGATIYVEGYYTVGDKGAGHFYAATGAAASTYVDNGGTIIVPTNGTGSSAWLRVIEGPLSVDYFGATGNGTTDDTTAIRNAIIAARTSQTDSSGRTYCNEVFFPAGNYRITGTIAMAPANGVVGLTLSGAGAGATWLKYEGTGIANTCNNSRSVTFRDLTFYTSAVDNDLTAFSMVGSGTPIRYWKFDRCEFINFYKCFTVTGSALCSEIFFHKAQFITCYYLMDNNNPQAVNWNFVDCNWENANMITAKDKNLSSAFLIQYGTFVKWTGGSFVFDGRLVYYNITVAGAVQRTSHRICFDGVRMELVDDGAGAHVPFVDKPLTGYISGSNTPVTSLINCSILQRGAIPITTVYARAWSNCTIEMTDCECEGGYITGVMESNTSTQNPYVSLQSTYNVIYREDTASRLNTHDQANVSVNPNTASGTNQLILDFRNGGLSTVSSSYNKRAFVRGPTGSLPAAGTTVNLPSIPDHFVFISLFCYRFTVAGSALTIELKDQADTTVYGTLTVGAGVTNGTAYVGKEMGFQIPTATPLMLKFTGTPEVVKGVVGLEYL